MPGKDELGKTLMKPCSNNSNLVAAMLNDYNTGYYSQNALRQKYTALGLPITKSNLSRMLSSELYAGLLKIKEYLDEPTRIVKALHIPLITESTYRENQIILRSKCRLKEKPTKDSEYLPLRGKILKCPDCNRNLTGYTKKKPSGKLFHYYNCDANKGCGFSCNASKANNLFIDNLKNIVPTPQVLKAFEKVLTSKYESMHQTRNQLLNSLEKRRKEIILKQDKLVDVMIDGKISQDIYERKNESLETTLNQIQSEINNTPKQDESMEKFVQFGLKFISQVDVIYEKADIKTKKRILSSILCGNPVFDGEKYRTLEFTEPIKLLSKYNKGFMNSENKNGRLQLRNLPLSTRGGT